MGKVITLTLEDMMAMAEQRRTNGPERKVVPLPGLGAALEVEKVPVSRVLSLLEGANENSVRENMEFQKELIYTCCPLLRTPALQETYACSEPTDIVTKVLDDNLGDMVILVDAILGFYGLSDDDGSKDMVDYIKN